MRGRTNKYHAVGVRDLAGHYFPSKGEAARARNLELQVAGGLIRDLHLHPTVEIFPGLSWKLDSSYVETVSGTTYWEDFKGVMNRDTAIKIKIWQYLGPGPLRITKMGSGGIFRVDKEYWPKGVAKLQEDLKRWTA